LFYYLPFYNSFKGRMRQGEFSNKIKKDFNKNRIKNLEKAISIAIKTSTNFFSDV